MPPRGKDVEDYILKEWESVSEKIVNPAMLETDTQMDHIVRKMPKEKAFPINACNTLVSTCSPPKIKWSS